MPNTAPALARDAHLPLLSTEAAPGYLAHEAIFHHLQGGHGSTPAPAGQSTHPRSRGGVGWGRGPPGGQETDQTRIVRGRLDTVRVLCCQQRISTLSQGAPGLPTKAFSASVSMRSTDRVGCPAAFMGASMEWTQGELTTEHFEAHPLTCLQALTGCLLCADGVLGPGEQRGPGPHLGVHSLGWADGKSRKQCIGW